MGDINMKREKLWQRHCVTHTLGLDKTQAPYIHNSAPWLCLFWWLQGHLSAEGPPHWHDSSIGLGTGHRWSDPPCPELSQVSTQIRKLSVAKAVVWFLLTTCSQAVFSFFHLNQYCLLHYPSVLLPIYIPTSKAVGNYMDLTGTAAGPKLLCACMGAPLRHTIMKELFAVHQTSFYSVCEIWRCQGLHERITSCK